jgi:hypothetical protein
MDDAAHLTFEFSRLSFGVASGDFGLRSRSPLLRGPAYTINPEAGRKAFSRDKADALTLRRSRDLD